MAWDERYRRLAKGETILKIDESQNDDGSWKTVGLDCVGHPAPDPAYSSHRTYRRRMTTNDNYSVPEGYVLVPMEPTPEMIAAAWTVVRSRWPRGTFLGEGPAFKECMIAMLKEASK